MKAGDVIWWVVVDPETCEMIMRCDTRSEAREMAHLCDARIARVQVRR